MASASDLEEHQPTVVLFSPNQSLSSSGIADVSRTESSINKWPEISYTKPGEVTLKKFLPSGDCLPAWFSMSLIKKMPMFPAPNKTVGLFARELAQRVYINHARTDFDLTDPNNYCMNNLYNPLADPNLAFFLNTPRMRQLLQDLGQLSDDDKVLCNLKAYNDHCRWLQHVDQFEFRKQLDETRKRTATRSAPKKHDVKVAFIETQVTQEEEVTRTHKEHGADDTGFDSQTVEGTYRSGKSSPAADTALNSEQDQRCRELARHMEAAQKQQQQQQKKALQAARADILRVAHRRFFYSMADKKHRKRQRQKMKLYKKLMQDNLEFLKEVEEKRLEERAQKLREDTPRPAPYEKAFNQHKPLVTQETESERVARYQAMLGDEMNRRWQAQAGRLQDTRDKSLSKRKVLTDTYTRHLVAVFGGSASQRPGLPLSVCSLDSSKKAQDRRPGGWVPRSAKTSAGLASSSDTSRGPSRSVREDKDQRLSSALKGVGRKSSSTPLPSSKTDSLRSHLRKKVATRRASSKFSSECRPAYPFKSQHLGNDDPKPRPGDEVRIYIAQELILMMMKGESGEETVMEEVRKNSSRLEDPLPVVEERASECEGLSEPERRGMEDLLKRLLGDLSTGRLEHRDLVKLTACCAALTESRLQMEVATSTTSLQVEEEKEKERIREEKREQALESVHERPAVHMQAESVSADQGSDSSLSSGVDRYVRETIERVQKERQEAEEAVGQAVVEDTITAAMSHISQDLRDGTVSREDVCELGSAVASAIVNEVSSDSSLLAEQLVIPTVQSLLDNGKDVDQVLLGETIASLLAAYSLTTGARERPAWLIVKEFVLGLLQRTDLSVDKGVLDMGTFFLTMEASKRTPLHQQLELPNEQELPVVLKVAIKKLSGVEELCPVICDLMKVLLHEGQTLLASQHGASGLCLPRINTALLDQMAETSRGVEVAFEVAACVCDGLCRDVHTDTDSQLDRRLQLTLAPPLLLDLLTAWGEMTAALTTDRCTVSEGRVSATCGAVTSTADTVALQTPQPSRTHPVSIRRERLAEQVVVVALSCMCRDARANALTDEAVTCLALFIAEFPTMTALLPQPGEAGEKVSLPSDVSRKLSKLLQAVQDDQLTLDQTEKLLAVMLHLYVRHVLLLPYSAASSSVPQLAADDCQTMRGQVIDLLNHLTDRVLDWVHRQTSDRPADSTATDVAPPAWKVLQLMAERGLHDLRRALQGEGDLGVDVEDVRLQDIHHACVWGLGDKEESAELLDPVMFLQSLLQCVEQKTGDWCSSLQGSKRHSRDVQLMSTALTEVVSDMLHMLSGMAVLYQDQGPAPCSLTQKMLTFVITLLMEMHHCLDQNRLPLPMARQFLAAVAPELCSPQAGSGGEREEVVLGGVMMALVQDLEKKRNTSRYFRRLVRQLSKMSLEDPDQSKAAEGMACTAHLLSTVDPSVLTQFIHTSLFSLLASLHTTPSSQVDVLQCLQQPAEDEQLLQLSGESTEAEGSRTSQQSSSTSDETGPNSTSTKELNKEALLIARLAIQTTMDRLGVAAGPASLTSSQSSTDMEIRDLLSDLQNAASQTKPAVDKSFSNLDPAMAAYAQELLADVTKNIKDDEGTEEEATGQRATMCTHSMAALIISSTFRSIESSIDTGVLRLRPPNLQTGGSSIDHRKPDGFAAALFTSQGSDESGREISLSDLSACITATLRAVRSELDLLDLTSASTQDMEVQSGSALDDPSTLGKARQIVDFLIGRVQADTAENRVEFKVTKKKQLSVERIARSVKKTACIWESSNSILTNAILNTFRDVLRDMHTQNQFFNPDAPDENGKARPSGSTVIPSLPYLLDELILSNLMMIVNQLSKHVPGRSLSSLLDDLSPESCILIYIFRDVIRAMIAEERPCHTHEQQEMEAKRQFLLRVLDKAVNAIILEAFIRDSRSQSASASIDDSKTLGWRKKMKVGVPRAQVTPDLYRLLETLRDLLQAVGSPPGTPPTDITEETHNDRVLVMTAVQQLRTSVQQDRVAAYTLTYLQAIFLPDSSTVLKDDLLAKVSVLLTATNEGRVPDHCLTKAALRLSFLENRPIKDPQLLSEAVRLATEASFSSSHLGNGSSEQPGLQYFRMALADLLAEKVTVEASSGSTGSQITMSASGAAIAQATPPAVEATVKRRSSINFRTVSKTKVDDNRENRTRRGSLRMTCALSGTLMGHLYDNIIVEQRSSIISASPSQAATSTGLSSTGETTSEQSSNSDPGVEGHSGIGADTRPDTSVHSGNGSDTRPDTSVHSDNGSDTRPDTSVHSDNGSDTRPDTSVHSDNGSDTRPDTSVHSGNGSDTRPDTSVQSGNGSDTRPDTSVHSDNGSDTRPNTSVHSDNGSDTRPDTSVHTGRTDAQQRLKAFADQPTDAVRESQTLADHPVNATTYILADHVFDEEQDLPTVAKCAELEPELQTHDSQPENAEPGSQPLPRLPMDTDQEPASAKQKPQIQLDLHADVKPDPPLHLDQPADGDQETDSMEEPTIVYRRNTACSTTDTSGTYFLSCLESSASFVGSEEGEDSTKSPSVSGNPIKSDSREDSDIKNFGASEKLVSSTDRSDNQEESSSNSSSASGKRINPVDGRESQEHCKNSNCQKLASPADRSTGQENSSLSIGSEGDPEVSVSPEASGSKDRSNTDNQNCSAARMTKNCHACCIDTVKGCDDVLPMQVVPITDVPTHDRRRQRQVKEAVVTTMLRKSSRLLQETSETLSTVARRTEMESKAKLGHRDRLVSPGRAAAGTDTAKCTGTHSVAEQGQTKGTVRNNNPPDAGNTGHIERKSDGDAKNVSKNYKSDAESFEYAAKSNKSDVGDVSTNSTSDLGNIESNTSYESRAENTENPPRQNTSLSISTLNAVMQPRSDKKEVNYSKRTTVPVSENNEQHHRKSKKKKKHSLRKLKRCKKSCHEDGDPEQACTTRPHEKTAQNRAAGLTLSAEKSSAFLRRHTALMLRKPGTLQDHSYVASLGEVCCSVALSSNGAIHPYLENQRFMTQQRSSHLRQELRRQHTKVDLSSTPFNAQGKEMALSERQQTDTMTFNKVLAMVMEENCPMAPHSPSQLRPKRPTPVLPDVCPAVSKEPNPSVQVRRRPSNLHTQTDLSKLAVCSVPLLPSNIRQPSKHNKRAHHPVLRTAAPKTFGTSSALRTVGESGALPADDVGRPHEEESTGTQKGVKRHPCACRDEKAQSLTKNVRPEEKYRTQSSDALHVSCLGRNLRQRRDSGLRGKDKTCVVDSSMQSATSLPLLTGQSSHCTASTVDQLETKGVQRPASTTAVPTSRTRTPYPGKKLQESRTYAAVHLPHPPVGGSCPDLQKARPRDPLCIKLPLTTPGRFRMDLGRLSVAERNRQGEVVTTPATRDAGTHPQHPLSSSGQQIPGPLTHCQSYVRLKSVKGGVPHFPQGSPSIRSCMLYPRHCTDGVVLSSVPDSISPKPPD